MAAIIDLGKQLLECAKNGETEKVQALVTGGAPFTTDCLGSSPLHMAAQFGHIATAEVLLRAGISRDAKTKVDRTPLHIAAEEGHLEIVNLLIKHGSEVDARDMLKMTPLHWAVERGHIDVVQCLLKCDASIHVENKFHKTPICIAEDNCREDILQMLQMYSSARPITKEKKINSNPCVAKLPLAKLPIARLPKPPPLLPKPSSAIPLSVVEPESLASLCTKSEVNSVALSSAPDIRYVRSLDELSRITVPASSVFATSDLRHIQCSTAENKDGNTSHNDEQEDSSEIYTSVLSTLATLAEATGPNTTVSTQEALHWLELHGITMLPSDDSTIVASVLEAGQTFSLTEAGRLALTFKESKNLYGSTEIPVSKEILMRKQPITTISNSAPNQKIITIVADQFQVPSMMNTVQPPVVLSSQEEDTKDNSPPTKRTKSCNDTINTTSAIEESYISLRKELENMKKQAAEYKAQLLIKENEAEQYKRQLEQLKECTAKLV